MDQERQKPDISSLKIDKSKKYDDRPKSKWWRWVVAVIVLAAMVWAYFSFKQSVVPATSVRVAIVKMSTGSDAAADLVATGYVVAQRLAEVASKGTGRLEYIGFEEGDTVASGEVIASLDNDDIEANLEMAKAGLAQAEVDTLNYGRKYRRAVQLFESGSITDAELEDAETAYRNSQAGIAGAAATVKVAEVELENTYIKAPFSGTILTKNAEIGEMVAPFASSQSSKGSVVTLADMNSLEVEADVSEANIYKVVVGQRCDIVLDAYPNIRYPGAVKKIVPTADRARATVLTRVEFREIDEKVLPEMSARVNFFVSNEQTDDSEAEALTVAKDAITVRDGSKVAFRIDGEYVTEVAVTLGRDLGGVVEILSGLKSGDRVVLNPPGKMETEEKIEISR